MTYLGRLNNNYLLEQGQNMGSQLAITQVSCLADQLLHEREEVWLVASLYSSCFVEIIINTGPGYYYIIGADQTVIDIRT